MSSVQTPSKRISKDLKKDLTYWKQDKMKQRMNGGQKVHEHDDNGESLPVADHDVALYNNGRMVPSKKSSSSILASIESALKDIDFPEV